MPQSFCFQEVAPWPSSVPLPDRVKPSTRPMVIQPSPLSCLGFAGAFRVPSSRISIGPLQGPCKLAGLPKLYVVLGITILLVPPAAHASFQALVKACKAYQKEQ
jgi:hypothetical protein